MSDLHVLFRVGEADYVLPADEVLQMEAFEGATHVPGVPGHVAGLVQVRGRVVPVVDLRVRFGLPRRERDADSRLVVVEGRGRTVALLADRAREVVQIPDERFSAPPEVVARRSRGLVRDVAQVGDRLVLRLNFHEVVGEEAIHGDRAEG